MGVRFFGPPCIHKYAVYYGKLEIEPLTGVRRHYRQLAQTTDDRDTYMCAPMKLFEYVEI